MKVIKVESCFLCPYRDVEMGEHYCSYSEFKIADKMSTLVNNFVHEKCELENESS
jgi:hypothetical protein